MWVLSAENSSSDIVFVITTWLLAAFVFMHTISRHRHFANMIAKVLALQIYSAEWVQQMVG